MYASIAVLLRCQCGYVMITRIVLYTVGQQYCSHPQWNIKLASYSTEGQLFNVMLATNNDGLFSKTSFAEL